MESYTHSTSSASAINAKNRKTGLVLVITPFAGLVAILSVFALLRFIASSSGVMGEDPATLLRIINVALSFLGIVFVIWVFVGVPIGIVYLSKRAPADGTPYDERSGRGDESIPPDEIKGWNWGAFGLSFIWGISHRVWRSFFCLIPILGFPISIYLGVKGNELAWKNDKWISVDAFKKSQKKWKAWGIAGFTLSMLAAIFQLAASTDTEPAQTLVQVPASSYQTTQSTMDNSLGDPDQNQESQRYSFVSTEDRFKLIFPHQPSREEESSEMDGVGTIKTTTYTSQKDGSSYLLVVHTFFGDVMSEDNPDFSAVGAMEGAMNEIANSEGAQLVSSKKITANGKDAYRYEIRIQDETLSGIIVYKGNRMYNVVVNYLSQGGMPLGAWSYLYSLELLN